MKKSFTDVHNNRKVAYASNSSRVRQFPTLDASPSKTNRKSQGSFFQDKKFSGQINQVRDMKTPEEVKSSPSINLQKS